MPMKILLSKRGLNIPNWAWPLLFRQELRGLFRLRKAVDEAHLGYRIGFIDYRDGIAKVLYLVALQSFALAMILEGPCTEHSDQPALQFGIHKAHHILSNS